MRICLLKNDTLYFSLYEATVVASEYWETIRENDRVLERQSFTLDQMNEGNWEIVYNK